MEEKKKNIGLIIALILALFGIIGFLVYRDEKKLNERIAQFKDSVKNFFTKKENKKDT